MTKLYSIFSSRIPKLYIKNPTNRINILQNILNLSDCTVKSLIPGYGLNLLHANHMIENVIGILGIPLGIGVNFIINNKSVVIPMAIEEPSIIAGCSKIGHLITISGGFFTKISHSFMIGQIELKTINNINLFLFIIKKYKKYMIKKFNKIYYSMFQRGGGCFDLKAKTIEMIEKKENNHIIIEFIFNCCDSMGANIINSLAEYLSFFFLSFFFFLSYLKILTNFSDKRLAKSKLNISYYNFFFLSKKNIINYIYNAFLFSCTDPYRTCTHNKGILNGIDSILLATGNDWRAVNSSFHTYASRYGNYRTLTKYKKLSKFSKFQGFSTIPLAIGIIGGSTKINPTIRTCFDLLNPFNTSIRRLSSIIISIALAQNLAALHALSTDGIQKGHMRLHKKKITNKRFLKN